MYIVLIVLLIIYISTTLKCNACYYMNLRYAHLFYALIRLISGIGVVICCFAVKGIIGLIVGLGVSGAILSSYKK